MQESSTAPPPANEQPRPVTGALHPVTGNEPPDAIAASQRPTSAQTTLETVDRVLAVGQSTLLQVSTANADGSTTIDTVPVVKTDDLPAPTLKPLPED